MSRALFLLLVAAALVPAQSKRPVIGVGGVMHETNTFNPRKTTVADFEEGIGAAGLLRGAAGLKAAANGNTAITRDLQGGAQFAPPTVGCGVPGPQQLGGGVRSLSPAPVRMRASNPSPGKVYLPAFGRPLFRETTFDGIGFGLGVSVTLDPIAGKVPGNAGEFAWGGAASTAFLVDPVDDLTVMFFTPVSYTHLTLPTSDLV